MNADAAFADLLFLPEMRPRIVKNGNLYYCEGSKWFPTAVGCAHTPQDAYACWKVSVRHKWILATSGDPYDGPSV